MPYQQTLANGTVLIDEFRIMGHLGSGGFANTYLAMDLTLGREVAIKEYFPSELAIRASSERVEVKSSAHGAQFEWALGRFVREAKTLAKFRHPSVVRVFRVFNANDTAYIVLEFVRGSNMESWIKSLGRPPSQAEFDELLPPLLDALEVVHGAGILHRDIKPANIYIRAADQTPVLLDFGAARYAAGDYAGTTAAIVSKGYSPHEAYATDSRLQGPWTDIYGLAATIYRALSGTAPPESTMRVLEDHCIPSVALDLPAEGGYREEFLQAIDWGLAVMPRDRPQSVAEWRYNLLPATAGQPRLRDANGEPTTVQEWNPISDTGEQATTFDPPGASGSRPQSGGSQARRPWPSAPGPQSGTAARPSAGSAGRAAVVGGAQSAPRQSQSRAAPQRSAPPSAASAPASAPASTASSGRQPVPPPGVVDRQSAPVGNRTFIIGLALFAAGGLALAGQWFISREPAGPGSSTSPARIEREVAGLDAERRERERASELARREQAEREAELERRRAAEAEESKKAAAAEAERRRVAEEAEAKRREEAEAERRRTADEAERKRLAEVESERRRQAEEAENKRRAEAAAEAERRRVAAEAEAKRQAEIEAERRRVAAEAEAKRQAEIETERKRLAAEAEAKRQAEIEAERKRVAAEAEAKRQAEIEAERRRVAAEAEAKRQAEAEAERRRLAAEAERQKIAEEEAERKRRLEVQLAARQTEAQGAGTELAAASVAGDTSDARISPLAGVYGTDESSRRIGYIKNMQAALKSSKCYQGELDGEVNSTRDALSAFEERYKGDVMKIDVASASASDFERWLGWFWRQESFYCYERPSKQPDVPSSSRRRTRDADEAKERAQRERDAEAARAREVRERRRQEREDRKSRADKVRAPVKAPKASSPPKSSAPAYKPPKAPAYRPPSGGGGGGGSDLLRGGR